MPNVKPPRVQYPPESGDTNPCQIGGLSLPEFYYFEF